MNSVIIKILGILVMVLPCLSAQIENSGCRNNLIKDISLGISQEVAASSVDNESQFFTILDEYPATVRAGVCQVGARAKMKIAHTTVCFIHPTRLMKKETRIGYVKSDEYQPTSSDPSGASELKRVNEASTLVRSFNSTISTSSCWIDSIVIVSDEGVQQVFQVHKLYRYIGESWSEVESAITTASP